MTDEEWEVFRLEVKDAVWEISPPGHEDPDWFYSWKFTPQGEVRDGWSYTSLLTWYWWDAKKTCTRDAYTTADRYKVKR